jgi:glutathione synthase/RimK-type ligase-like ATP-grasp enzyme
MSTSDPVILILGERCDPHIRKVCGHLDKMGARHSVVDPFETVLLPALAHPKSSADRYTAIWDRLKPIAAPKSNRGQYILRERVAAVRSLQLLHGQARLMNPPSATETARSKLFQLSIARQAGLDTPKTYVSNDAKAVRNFVASCDKGAVAKSLTWFFDSAGKFTFTNVITPGTLGSKAALACCPMIYQEYILKRYELRVTCVGRKIYAARILSQRNAITVVDWRRDQFNLDYEATTLPTGLERKITCVLKALGLHFGAFDFVVTPEGRCVFLEVNSSGNWLWLENQLPLPISRAVAEWLFAHGRAEKREVHNLASTLRSCGTQGRKRSITWTQS